MSKRNLVLHQGCEFCTVPAGMYRIYIKPVTTPYNSVPSSIPVNTGRFRPFRTVWRYQLYRPRFWKLKEKEEREQTDLGFLKLNEREIDLAPICFSNFWFGLHREKERQRSSVGWLVILWKLFFLGFPKLPREIQEEREEYGWETNWSERKERKRFFFLGFLFLPLIFFFRYRGRDLEPIWHNFDLVKIFSNVISLSQLSMTLYGRTNHSPWFCDSNLVQNKGN